MKNIIICDIDGTLADCTHRRHFVEPPKVTAEQAKFPGGSQPGDDCFWCGSKIGTSHRKDCETIVVMHPPYGEPNWKPDWESFFLPELVMKDELIMTVFNVLMNVCEDGNKQLILTTGRMEKHRAITIEWLDRNGICTLLDTWDEPDQDLLGSLLMRQDDDYRDDAIIKEEMLMKIGPENVFCVFEDRKRVVDMWRRHGLTCFQVAEGDF